MNLFTFTVEFGDEQACRKHFKEERVKYGFVYKKYSNTTHYWKRYKEYYQFKSSAFRTSLCSGTIMENSNLPFLIWYRAMFLMSTIKKDFQPKKCKDS
jgi:hypothetical protein